MLDDHFNKLQSLVDQYHDNEVECGKALEPLVQYLPRSGRFIQCKGEFTHSDGRVDIIIIEETGLGQMQHRYANVWELKSPRKALFTLRKGSKIFDPTDDLVQAESQLIQYVYHFTLTDDLRRYGVERDSVRPRGIIIGTSKSICRDASHAQEEFSSSDDFKWSLYTKALGSRRQFLYTPAGIQLMTWDEVLKMVEPRSVIHNELRQC